MKKDGAVLNDKKPLNIAIGNRIRIYREYAGLTQERFAEMIGMMPKSISAIERGLVGVSVETLTTICKTLHISSDALIFGDEQVGADAAHEVSERLAHLDPAQQQIAIDVLNKLLEAFAVGNSKEQTEQSE